MSKIVLAGNALVAPVLAGNLPCLSRWGGQLPRWVCALGGQRTPQQISGGLAVLAGAVTAVVAISGMAVLHEWRRSGLSFRDWWDSLR